MKIADGIRCLPIASSTMSFIICAMLCGGAVFCRATAAQTGTLAEPFPAPAANAALHYQRALLHLSSVDPSELAPLDHPIWETNPLAIGDSLSPELLRLLEQTRFAIAATANGSRMFDCNFGIDFSQAGAASQLPHVEGMVSLGRLLTLRGARAEASGEWEQAMIIYFDGLRVGRHLTHQPTLLEALAGIEILRNNYFALAGWATRCPVRLLVARAFGLLEAMQVSLVHPSQIIAREASIMSLEFQQLRDAYPDGEWPEQILHSFGIAADGNPQQKRSQAIEACVKRGVPKATFESDEAFPEYLDRLETTAARFVESVAACMTLPPRARLRRAAALNRKYAIVIPILAAETLIDPVELGALFAQHEAELLLTRLALAVAASKKDQKYPLSLDVVSDRFGDAVPLDPYRGEAVGYQVADEGRAFSIEILAMGPLPGVSFHSRTPSAAE